MQGTTDSRDYVLTDVFESERLIYRAIDEDQDEDFIFSLRSDSITTQLSNSRISIPTTRKANRAFIKHIAEDRLLGVMICLKPLNDNEPTPIGYLHFSKNDFGEIHHRYTELGITVANQYQGKGYGGEAILWATGWAFERMGLNRVDISTSEYNKRGIYLYQKLGFTLEGKLRQHIWHNGRFWDYYLFGMLASEWKARSAAP